MPDFPPVTVPTLPTSKCYAYLSANQLNLLNATWTKILLDSHFFDVDVEFDHVNHRWIAKKSGYYLILAAIMWAGIDAVDAYWGCIATNNSEQGKGPNDPVSGLYNLSQSGDYGAGYASGVCPHFKMHAIVHLNAGEYVELYAYHSRGVNTPDIDSVPNCTYLSIVQLA